MKKLNILKFFFSLSIFFFVIKFSKIKINFNYFTLEAFLILTIFLLTSFFFISLRTNIIYNYNKLLSIKKLFFLTIYSWSATTLLISGVSEYIKFIFFKRIEWSIFISLLFFEKILNLFTIFLLIFVIVFILSEDNFLFSINKYIFFFFLLFVYYLFKNNFFLQKIPYLNFINYNFKQILNNQSYISLFKILLCNIILHLLSFFSFFQIILFLEIKIDFKTLLLLYCINYISGLLQIFPGGLGIREFMFIILSNITNSDQNAFLNLSIFLTSFHILAAIIIYFYSYYHLFKKKRLT
jgi:uncharacterized membrane protein YbhN (UPF0104 family)